VLSPLLFAVYLDGILHIVSITGTMHGRFQIGGTRLGYIMFADDLALTASSQTSDINL